MTSRQRGPHRLRRLLIKPRRVGHPHPNHRHSNLLRAVVLHAQADRVVIPAGRFALPSVRMYGQAIGRALGRDSVAKRVRVRQSMRGTGKSRSSTEQNTDGLARGLWDAPDLVHLAAAVPPVEPIRPEGSVEGGCRRGVWQQLLHHLRVALTHQQTESGLSRLLTRRDGTAGSQMEARALASNKLGLQQKPQFAASQSQYE